MTCPTNSSPTELPQHRLRPAPSFLILAPTPYDHPDARTLTRALHAEQQALYGFADDPSDTPPEEFATPRGLFVIGNLQPTGIAVACGGWRCLKERTATAEIKRMYVTPDARGHGHARRLLQHLEQTAAEAGITRMLLETGRDNTGALALYASRGYRTIPPYVTGRDPQVNRALAKHLTR
jgi:GNAT superfamily N-acetyltransferase